MTTVPVIFRRTKKGQVIAFFPTLPGDEDMPDSVCKGFTKDGECYLNISQIYKTAPANYAEYLPLLEPMANAGYRDISIVKRVSSSFEEMRLNGGEIPAEQEEEDTLFYTQKVDDKKSVPSKRMFGRQKVA